MPFSLNIAPRVFTKPCLVIIKELGGERYEYFCVPWRLDYLGANTLSLPSSPKASVHYDPEGHLDYECREVSILSNTSHSVAGTHMGHEESIPVPFPSMLSEGEGFSFSLHEVQIHHPPSSLKDCRSDKFFLQSKSIGENLSQASCSLRELAKLYLGDIPVPLSPELKGRLLHWLRLKV